jgi:hypothetical protein
MGRPKGSTTKTPEILAWEKPYKLTNATDWTQVAQDLRDEPGQWAVVRTAISVGALSSVRSSLKKGKYRGFEANQGRDYNDLEFEVDVSKRVVDGKFGLYVRWVGPNGEHRKVEQKPQKASA